MDQSNPDDPESNLRQSWSIGPLRSWLVQIAKRELPKDLQGKLDPSDIAQQTMMDAWRGEERFQGTTHAQRLAWLRVILRRVVLQQHRKAMSTKRGAGAERAVTDAISHASIRIEELASGNEPQPDEGVVNAEKSLQLAEALETMPEDYRRVIELRHFDGKTHEQVAQELGRSNAAVRVLWVRALAELRKRCSSQDFENA
ncbi:MAG: sigma-70 family RNA polymerase sigma factor [Pirellulaceae bacterium]